MAKPQDEDQLASDASGQDARDTPSAGSERSSSGGGYFEIHVKGHLNSQWSDWLEGLELRLLDSGETVLSGTIVDQAALMGILNKLNRLNLAILSVSHVNRRTTWTTPEP